MKRHVAVLAALGALVFGDTRWPVAAASPTTKAERSRAASRMVSEALGREIDGADADRDALLGSALEQVPDYAPAMWHSGWLQDRNQWWELDELFLATADDPRLVAYRRIRPQYPETVEGQLALAEWCAKRKLVDQQRAHLTKVLQLNPDHQQARRLLGHRQVDGAWRSTEEIAEAQLRAKQTAASLREWEPKLTKIRNELEHRSQRQRENAKSRLLAIDDPAAVPALEAVFSRHSEQAALLTVEALANISDAEASVALARQAVFSGWESVRMAAAEKLKTRDFHGFVPMLLAAMGTPVQSRAQLYQAPGGRLMYRHTLFREGRQENEVAVFETEYRRAVLHTETPEETATARNMLAAARQRDAVIKAQAREMAVARQNAVVQQLNERIGWVLCRATGAKLPATADSWWKWWNDYNEVFLAGSKPLKGTYYRSEVAFEDPYKYAPSTPAPGPQFSRGSPAQRYECLAAGTLVWTESGPVPIERVRVGDRLLSQDPETGCLACKPVLKTTLRPTGPTLTIKTVDEPIHSSGGHPFWIAGQGWVKARDLKPGAFLHRLTGTTKIRALAQSGRQPTYNLIVADFHTYFVGLGKILSHDNTVRQPTNALVPGLAMDDP